MPSASASCLHQSLVLERFFGGGTIVTPRGTQLPLAGLGALGEGGEVPAAGEGPSAAGWLTVCSFCLKMRISAGCFSRNCFLPPS